MKRGGGGLNKRKKAQADEVEQISFKLLGKEARLKQRFLEMLQRRGSSMRDRLIAYMYFDVKHDGEVVMMPLRAHDSESTDFPQDFDKYLGGLGEVTMESPSHECYSQLAIILDQAPEDIRDLVTRTIEKFAQVTVQHRLFDENIDGRDKERDIRQPRPDRPKHLPGDRDVARRTGTVKNQSHLGGETG